MTEVKIDSVSDQLEIYKKLKNDIKYLEERAEEARKFIEEVMGDNEIGTIDGQVAVKWTTTSRESIDLKAAKELLPPTVYAELVRKTESRRFTIEKDKK